MVGIVVSLPWELKSLTRQAIPVGAWKALSASTLVALSGIGAERAYAAGSVLVAQGATALISWGYAAALDGRLRPGCLMLPELVISADGEIYPVSAEWHRQLRQSLEPKHAICSGALVESDAIVKTPGEKRALAIRTRAAATDMESAAQARLAKERRLPFVVIRAIIDTASTDIPEKIQEAFRSQGEVRAWKILTSAALRPIDWIKMIRLGIQFNAAQRTLKKTGRLVLNSPRL